MDDGGFSGAGNASHAAKQTERNVEVDAAQVMDACAEADAGVRDRARRRCCGSGMVHATGEIFAGDGVRVGGDLGDGAGGQ